MKKQAVRGLFRKISDQIVDRCRLREACTVPE